MGSMIEGLAIAIFSVYLQLKAIRFGAYNTSRYLANRSRPQDVIVPEQAAKDYFGVFFDRWGRMWKWERYNKSQELLLSVVFEWSLNRVKKAYYFNERGELQKYEIFYYVWHSKVTHVDVFSPESEFIETLTDGV